MDKDKACGPDGFAMMFFNEFCDVNNDGLLGLSTEFHWNGVIGISINSNFITPVLKKGH